MTILLTGANGFVGSALSKKFLDSKINYLAAIRTLDGKNNKSKIQILNSSIFHEYYRHHFRQ